jgi:hypothetical protein
MPEWNCRTRELFFASKLIKRFVRPTPVLAMILDAFEESGWPSVLDDPLPPEPDLISQQRLHDAIKRLNRCQKPFRIRFMGDGTGKAIRWAPAKRKRTKRRT